MLLPLAARFAVPITVRVMVRNLLRSRCIHEKEDSATDSVRLSEYRKHSDRIDLRRQERRDKCSRRLSVSLGRSPKGALRSQFPVTRIELPGLKPGLRSHPEELSENILQHALAAGSGGASRIN